MNTKTNPRSEDAGLTRWASLAGVAVLSALVVLFFQLGRGEAATSPSLGAASSFAILAGTPNITNIFPSVITGDVGLHPATGAAIELRCSEVTGTIYDWNGLYTGGEGSAVTTCRETDNGLLIAAKAALVTAFNNLSAGANAGCPAATDFGAVTQELSGLTLVPGIYCANAFQLSGPLPLILDDTSAANGVWIFKANLSTLNTTPGGVASVEFLTGAGSYCNVWWKVATSATIGSYTDFIGNILALASISLGTGASLDGRALARNGAVTLESNTVSAEDCLPPTGPEATQTQQAAATATQQAAATATARAAATATARAAATATAAAAAAACPCPPNVIIPVDIDNTNTNALNNDNINDNNNQNENTQEQSNVQEQTNDNNQTTTVNSSPSVRIAGVPRAVAPAGPPSAAAPTIITPPSTGSGGLLPQSSESSTGARLLLVALTGVIAAGVTAGGARVRSRK